MAPQESSSAQPDTSSADAGSPSAGDPDAMKNNSEKGIDDHLFYELARAIGRDLLKSQHHFLSVPSHLTCLHQSLTVM